jgi:prepilin-type N-terminal cleavage/methylation domain-containing protein
MHNSKEGIISLEKGAGKDGWLKRRRFLMGPEKHAFLSKRAGFTLVEVLVAVGILAVVIVGLLRLFIYCSILSDLSGNMTLATNEAQSKLEEIRNHDYGSIVTDYSSGGTPGNTFNLTELTGMGVITIDNSNPDLLQIDINVSWQNKDGRISGEDTDLDGVIDAGEDLDSNGKLDSIASIVSLIARR